MSRWDEKFESHPIHETLQESSDLINSEHDDIDSEAQSEKRRLLKLINLFEETLKNLDPELVPYDILDGIDDYIRSDHTWNEFTSYNSSGKREHLEKANLYLDALFPHLSQLLAIAKKSKTTNPVRGLQKSLEEFEKSVSVKNKTLEAESDDLSKKIADNGTEIERLSDSVATHKRHTDDLLATWQKQNSDDQNKRNSDFTGEQKSRTKVFDDFKVKVWEEAATKVNLLITDSTKSLKAGREDFDKKISFFRDDAKEKHAEILALYGLVAKDSVAGGYLENAKDEKEQANFWRIGTIVFIIAAACWTGYAYIGDAKVIKGAEAIKGAEVIKNGEVLWIQMLRTFSLTGILLFGAAYSSKQSNLHRKNEAQARSFALKVSAFDPFVASLPEAERYALKNKISDHLFIQRQEDAEKEASTTE